MLLVLQNMPLLRVLFSQTRVQMQVIRQKRRALLAAYDGVKRAKEVENIRQKIFS